MTHTQIHLVRHAEVHNPDNIWYGRLEGFVLSEKGLRQAAAVGGHFAGAELAAVYTSPLIRAQQTAEAITGHHGIAATIEHDIIESEAKLQGWPGDRRLFARPANARYFLNPTRPSWGEPYASIRQRMRRAVSTMVEKHPGEEVVAVSHQTPILVTRLMYEQNPKQPWRARVPCERASITTLHFDDDRFTHVDYLPLGSGIE